jgi:hypothetical protein
MTIRYHLGDEKTPLVEIEWKPQGKDMPVRVRGEPVGVIASREELLAGRRFDLQGEELHVVLPKGTFVLPEVTLGGRRLYPPAASPEARLNRASTAILIIGAAQAFLGLRPLLDGGGELPTQNWLAIASGAVLLALGGLARLRSQAAVLAAFVLLVASWAYGIYAVAARVGEHGVPFLFVAGLVFQLGFLLMVYQGVGAIRDMRRDEGNG